MPRLELVTPSNGGLVDPVSGIASVSTSAAVWFSSVTARFVLHLERPEDPHPHRDSLQATTETLSLGRVEPRLPLVGQICEDAANLFKAIVADWLEKYMFSAQNNAAQKAHDVARFLGG